MTPTKTLYLNEIDSYKYVVDEEGNFLSLKNGNDTGVLYQSGEGRYLFEATYNIAGAPIENIQLIQVADEIGSFKIGGYTFEYDSEDDSFTCSDILSDFAGTGELVSHNFGVDELYLCDKSNNVVWATIGGQKVYFEQSAIGQFSIANNKPQTAAEMGAPAIEASQNVSFMLAGYVFILESTNTFASYPVPPTND